jgi:hypothetical protein
MAVEIGVLIAVIGCFVGLAGWLSGRDKKISDDSHWKGTVDENLKEIKDGVSGIGERMAKIEEAVATHETRITVLESKVDKEK